MTNGTYPPLPGGVQADPGPTRAQTPTPILNQGLALSTTPDPYGKLGTQKERDFLAGALDGQQLLKTPEERPQTQTPNQEDTYMKDNQMDLIHPPGTSPIQSPPTVRKGRKRVAVSSPITPTPSRPPPIRPALPLQRPQQQQQVQPPQQPPQLFPRDRAQGFLQQALWALKEAQKIEPFYESLIEGVEKATMAQGPPQHPLQPGTTPQPKATQEGLKTSSWAKAPTEPAPKAPATAGAKAPANTWAKVAAKPASKAPPKASAKVLAKAPTKKNAIEDFQVILKLQRGAPTPEIKPIELRNKLNKALNEIAILALSVSDRGNIVITTKAPYTAKKLLEEKAKWAPLLKELPIESADLPTSWTKLVAKGVPNLEETASLDIFAAEAMTFSGVKVLGQPRWLRTPGPAQRAGSVVFAVPSEAVGAHCRKEGLYVAGVRLRVEAYKEYTIRTQCYRCLSFGHNPRTCRRPVRCAFCSEKHLTRDHSCPSCKASQGCSHFKVSCYNCKGEHLTTSKAQCGVYKGIANA
jgi:hypothetical protein